jgi:hypothetical protein
MHIAFVRISGIGAQRDSDSEDDHLTERYLRGNPDGQCLAIGHGGPFQSKTPLSKRIKFTCRGTHAEAVTRSIVSGLV